MSDSAATGVPHFAHVVTDVGRSREVNEDGVGEWRLADGHLIVVADGMGGHAAGEVASAMVVAEVHRQMEASVGGDPRARIFAAITRAHEAVLRRAAELRADGMGSTVVACFIRGTEIVVAHVGDSRLYVIKNGAVYWKTADHTRVRRMIEAGVLTEEEARHHPEANVVTRAVGHVPKDGDGEFAPEVRPLDVVEGDSLVLCSDGLYDLVEDEEIAKGIAITPAAEGAERLVRLANERGGHDNVTVAVVHFGRDAGAPALPVPDRRPEERVTPTAPPVKPGSAAASGAGRAAAAAGAPLGARTPAAGDRAIDEAVKAAVRRVVLRAAVVAVAAFAVGAVLGTLYGPSAARRSEDHNPETLGPTGKTRHPSAGVRGDGAGTIRPAALAPAAGTHGPDGGVRSDSGAGSADARPPAAALGTQKTAVEVKGATVDRRVRRPGRGVPRRIDGGR